MTGAFDCRGRNRDKEKNKNLRVDCSIPIVQRHRT